MSETVPALHSLSQQIPLCLSRDRYRLSRAVQNIRERQKRKQPVEQDLQKLAQGIERSLSAVQARRKRAARTAWLAAAVALAVYAGFILTGVLGR